jgi:hypothetical protein
LNCGTIASIIFKKKVFSVDLRPSLVRTVEVSSVRVAGQAGAFARLCEQWHVFPGEALRTE